MKQYGYKKTDADHCVIVQKFSPNDFVILLLYVDDILIIGQSVERIDRLKQDLGRSFAIKDFGSTK